MTPGDRVNNNGSILVLMVLIFNKKIKRFLLLGLDKPYEGLSIGG